MLIATYPLLLAVALQAVLPACSEAPRSPRSRAYEPGPASIPSFASAPFSEASFSQPAFAFDPAGPTLSEFRAAFSGHTLLRSDAAGLSAFVAAHPGQGRLLTGSDLRLEMAEAVQQPYAETATRQDSVRRDSLAAHGTTRPQPHSDAASASSDRSDQSEGSGLSDKANDSEPKDTLNLGEPPRHEESDYTRVDDDEAKGWFANLMLDFTERGHGGRGGGLSGSDWAAIIYVVVGVVVVGAFILYGVQTLVELAANQARYPLFQELGLRLSYSGKEFRDAATGPGMYRDAYLTGLRYAMGFARPFMGMGLSVEGGYLDVKLRGISDPAHSFDFSGGYLVAGPLLRFGSNDPFSFSLEFLNGTATHASIGWISKTRMTLQAKVSRHFLFGAHLGAVFYDLHFLDGLGWRQGDFNRDLSLISGLDAGWEL